MISVAIYIYESSVLGIDQRELILVKRDQSEVDSKYTNRFIIGGRTSARYQGCLFKELKRYEAGS